jgi:hypothetical protein
MRGGRSNESPALRAPPPRLERLFFCRRTGNDGPAGRIRMGRRRIQRWAPSPVVTHDSRSLSFHPRRLRYVGGTSRATNCNEPFGLRAASARRPRSFPSFLWYARRHHLLHRIRDRSLRINRRQATNPSTEYDRLENSRGRPAPSNVTSIRPRRIPANPTWLISVVWPPGASTYSGSSRNVCV